MFHDGEWTLHRRVGPGHTEVYSVAPMTVEVEIGGKVETLTYYRPHWLLSINTVEVAVAPDAKVTVEIVER